MAVTKLMNIKQGKKGGGRHLYNSIHYILKQEKTEKGVWVGGNVGTEADEVYQAMLDTKRDWEKPGGRQGYHFFISFKPGETDEPTAYNVIKKFCEEYLGDNYDYVFSVHNDKKHMHGHIVFNSVNRISGYKYRYEKGDWARYIQPITDRLCVEYGLSPLEFEEKRKGKSYAQWNADKQGKPNWKKTIRADVDYAIAASKNEEDFLQTMDSMSYEVRKGTSRDHGIYFSFRAPGQGRSWRSYNLGAGYSAADIMQRIEKESFSYDYLRPPKLTYCKLRQSGIRGLTGFQKKRVRKLYRLSMRNRFTDVYRADARMVRQSLLHIDQLRDDVNYLLRRNIENYDALMKREQELMQEEKILINQNYSTEVIKGDEIYERYQQLKEESHTIPASDDRFEELLDEMDELEEKLPDRLPLDADAAIKDQLSRVRNEKRIIRHIKKEEKENVFLISKNSLRQNKPAKTMIQEKERNYGRKYTK